MCQHHDLNTEEIMVSLKLEMDLKYITIKGKFKGDSPRKFPHWGFIKLSETVSEDILTEVDSSEEHLVKSIVDLNPNAIYLNHIMVNPRRRRKGVATKALSELNKLLIMRGYNKVYLLCEEPLVQLYEKSEYRKVGDLLSNGLQLMEREI